MIGNTDNLLLDLMLIAQFIFNVFVRLREVGLKKMA